MIPKETLLLLKSWAQYLVLNSLLYTFILSFLLTITFYMYKGATELNPQTYEALFIVFNSIFSLLLYLIGVIFFVLSVQKVHKKCIKGYAIEILSCQKEPLEKVSLDDAFKVARRWLAISMWVLIVLIVFISSLYYLLFSSESMFEWMHFLLVYALFIFSSMLAFFVLLHRCKKVRVSRC